jgi:hypothetical protein
MTGNAGRDALAGTPRFAAIAAPTLPAASVAAFVGAAPAPVATLDAPSSRSSAASRPARCCPMLPRQRGDPKIIAISHEGGDPPP